MVNSMTQTLSERNHLWMNPSDGDRCEDQLSSFSHVAAISRVELSKCCHYTKRASDIIWPSDRDHTHAKQIYQARDDAKWEKTALACENAFCFRSNTSLRRAQFTATSWHKITIKVASVSLWLVGLMLTSGSTAKRAVAKLLLLAAKHSIFASSAFSSQLPILPTNNSVWVSLERKKIVTPGANRAIVSGWWRLWCFQYCNPISTAA